MGQRMVGVTALDYGRREAILDTGEVAPFETMIGPDGQDTDEIDGALGAVVPLADGCRIIVDFDDFGEGDLH